MCWLSRLLLLRGFNCNCICSNEIWSNSFMLAWKAPASPQSLFSRKHSQAFTGFTGLISNDWINWSPLKASFLNFGDFLDLGACGLEGHTRGPSYTMAEAWAQRTPSCGFGGWCCAQEYSLFGAGKPRKPLTDASAALGEEERSIPEPWRWQLTDSRLYTLIPGSVKHLMLRWGLLERVCVLEVQKPAAVLRSQL